MKRYRAGGRPRLAGRCGVAGGSQNASTPQHALQVGGIDLVTEGSAVDFAQCRHRELFRGQPECDVGVREFRGKSIARVPYDGSVVERHLRQLRNRVPGRVRWQLWVGAEGNESEEGRRDAARTRHALWITEDGELFEVGDLS